MQEAVESKVWLRPSSLTWQRSVLAYLTLAASVATFIPGHTVIATLLAFLAIGLGWGSLRFVGRVIFSLIILLSAAAFLLEPAALPKAAGHMSRIGALAITVMLLSAVMSMSNDLKIISRSLFAGKSITRYLSIASGTGLLAIPLNFGAVGVVATMIGIQVKEHGDSALGRNAARAVVRGFAISPMASPLSIAVVMTVTFLPGLSSWELIAVSLPLALLYLVGGLFARESEPASAEAPVLSDADESTLLPWLRFITTISLICLGVYLLSVQAELVYSQAVTLSCLAAVIAGLVYRRIKDGALSMPSLATVTNELVIIGGSSYLGGIIGVFALNWLGMDFSLPSWAYALVVFAVPWLFFAGGILGVNPIISVTLVGSIFGPVWPESSLLGLGVAIVIGWGITIAGTPYSVNSMMLERCSGYSAQRACYEWSLKYSLAALVLCSVFSALITLWL